MSTLAWLAWMWAVTAACWLGIGWLRIHRWEYRTGRRCHLCDRRRPCERVEAGWVCSPCVTALKIHEDGS